MNQKFKIGDRVKKDNSTYIIKSYLYDTFYKSYLYTLSFGDYGVSCNVPEEELELFQTSEQLAVEKFKEELREKINAKIMLLGMCSDVYVEEEAKSKLVRIEQLKEILKLLEE